MARNFQLVILRGVQANIPIDLGMGEPYFATDTGNFFLGTPGYGIGYVQIGDTTKVNETLKQMLLVMESVRRALVAIACEGGKSKPIDFDISTIANESNIDGTSIV